MADIVDLKTRSRMMSAIKGKNTKPELIVRKYLHALGFRYRLHDKKLPGTPDIVLAKFKTVIFVNGCFWHRHDGCKKCITPSSNIDFWTKKFEQTIARDKKAIDALEKLGWRVIVIWECQVNDKNVEKLAKQICHTI